ncbi:MAG: CDP-glycerol glycerophosphotransferase family protein [Sporolactobacillus sp.]
MNAKQRNFLKKIMDVRLQAFDADALSWHFQLRFSERTPLHTLDSAMLVICDRTGDTNYRFPLLPAADDAPLLRVAVITLPEVRAHFFLDDHWDAYVALPLDERAMAMLRSVDEDQWQRLAGETESDRQTADPDFDVRLQLDELIAAKLDLFTLYHEHGTQMLVPYATRKEGFSLKVEDTHVMARLEHAAIDKNYMLRLDGYVLADVGAHVNEKEILKKLFLVDAEERVISEWRMENTVRKDLTAAAGAADQHFDWTGFSVTIDLKPFGLELSGSDDITYLYFRVALTHPKNGLLITENPVRILAREVIVTGRHILKTGHRRKSLIVKRNKNKSVVLRIAPYTIPGALKAKMVRFGGRVRKSRFVSAMYHQSFRLLGRLPAKKQLVVFESFFGRQYSCNPRAIYEYMHQHCPQYQLVWSADPAHEDLFRSHGVPFVRRFSVKWLLAMTRAGYWVTNVRLPLWMVKPAHTVYLQTWHGTPLKKLALDMEEVHMPGTNTEKYKSNFLAESARWDYLISPNAYSSAIFARAFGFHGTMLETGYPRNDYLHHAGQDEELRLKKQLDLPLDKKIILYAPTWRDNQFYGRGRYKFELDLDLEQLSHELGDDYVLLLRMHYLVAEQLDLTEFEGFAYDFSAHEDIRELYLLADVLITDYSSVFFDYANLRRPIIFFTYDLEEYRDTLRGFYFDFEHQAPGPLVMTTSELICAVRNVAAAHFPVPAHFDEFYDRFCSMEDGHAADRVVRRVFEDDGGRQTR